MSSPEYRGWEPLINYARTDTEGNAGLWEWGYHDPFTGMPTFSGVLLGYRPPEQTPDEHMAAKENAKEK
jgi:hypothetical protein